MPLSIRPRWCSFSSLMPVTSSVIEWVAISPSSPRNVNRVVGALRLVVGKAEKGERGGRLLGFPFGLDGRELHLLHFAGRISGCVAEHDHRQRRRQAEARRDGERPQRKRDVAPFQQVPRRHAEHEHARGDVARRDRMHELHLRDRIEEHLAHAGDLHAHRLEVERGADGILHPAVGDQDPQRREVRAQRRAASPVCQTPSSQTRSNRSRQTHRARRRGYRRVCFAPVRPKSPRVGRAC